MSEGLNMMQLDHLLLTQLLSFIPNKYDQWLGGIDDDTDVYLLVPMNRKVCT